MLVALITTSWTNTPMVTGITQSSGTVNWTYARGSAVPRVGYGAETEIWYATNVQNAGSSATITVKSGGVLVPSCCRGSHCGIQRIGDCRRAGPDGD